MWRQFRNIHDGNNKKYWCELTLKFSVVRRRVLGQKYIHERVATMSSFLKTAVGKGGLATIALSAGMFFVKRVIQKKGVSTNIKFLVESLLHNDIEQRTLPEQVIMEAEAVAKIFEKQDVFPARIAIDGVPGSGKSTLAKALSERMGMEAICLDHQNMEEQLPFVQQPAIYEHHRLLRTQDIDSFDAIIYIDQPVDISKQHILHRERGAYLVDIMNFDLLKRIGDKAFALAEGPMTSIDDGLIKIRIRPDKGYNVMANLAGELRAKGFADSRIVGLSKEQQLFLLMEGHARKGFIAYLNPSAYEKDFSLALLEGVGSVFTKRGHWK